VLRGASNAQHAAIRKKVTVTIFAALAKLRTCPPFAPARKLPVRTCRAGPPVLRGASNAQHAAIRKKVTVTISPPPFRRTCETSDLSPFAPARKLPAGLAAQDRQCVRKRFPDRHNWHTYFLTPRKYNTLTAGAGAKRQNFQSPAHLLPRPEAVVTIPRYPAPRSRAVNSALGEVEISQPASRSRGIGGTCHREIQRSHRLFRASTNRPRDVCG
jgi:hypothetical protein